MTKHNPECGFLTCSMCDKEKPLDDFYKSPSSASGYQSRCKECTKAAASQRYHKAARARPYED